jgi:hypothetical protein
MAKGKTPKSAKSIKSKSGGKKGGRRTPRRVKSPENISTTTDIEPSLDHQKHDVTKKMSEATWKNSTDSIISQRGGLVGDGKDATVNVTGRKVIKDLWKVCCNGESNDELQV